MKLDNDWETMKKMCCLEVIEVRVTQHRQEDFQQALDKLKKETLEEKEVYTLQSYYRGSSGTDYLLVLHHRERIEDHRGSSIAQIMVDAFSVFSMIHHSIWYEWKKL